MNSEEYSSFVPAAPAFPTYYDTGASYIVAIANRKDSGDSITSRSRAWAFTAVLILGTRNPFFNRPKTYRAGGQEPKEFFISQGLPFY